MLLVLNLPLVGLWARVMLVPRPLLFGGILVLASLGAYSLNRSMLDLVILYGVGAVGCVPVIAYLPAPDPIACSSSRASVNRGRMSAAVR